MQRNFLIIIIFTAQLFYSGCVFADEKIADFFNPPYLTELSEDSVTINWRFKETSAATFSYGLSYNFELGTSRLNHQLQHKISLNNLSKDTIYKYKINNIYIGEFKTSYSNNSFDFAVLGHTHGTERFNNYPDKLLISRIEDLSPDFVIHTGDATYYSNVEDYHRYFFLYFNNILSKSPVYIAPGNHDAGWPFIYGVNLSVFKELFPYPYPDEITNKKKEAYYAIPKGKIQFLFLSYLSDMGPDSRQRNWLSEKLSDSEFDFNILVFGGAQKGYYDEESFYNFISKYNVNLILNGDGSQSSTKYLRYQNDIPIVFVGTNGKNPHYFLYAEYDNQTLSFKIINSVGQVIHSHWLSNNKIQTKLINLTIANKIISQKHKTISIKHPFDTPIDSTSVKGIQILLKAPDGLRGYAYAYIRPSDTSRTATITEDGLRTQWFDFVGSDKVVINLTIDQINPFKGKPYLIKNITLRITAATGNIEDFQILNAYVY